MGRSLSEQIIQTYICEEYSSFAKEPQVEVQGSGFIKDIRNLVQEIERVRIELAAIAEEKSHNLLDDEVLYASQNLDLLIVQYLTLLEKEQRGDK